jgi:hypothetical protein
MFSTPRHARYDVCLKILFLEQSGGLRAVKTLSNLWLQESTYEPPAVSLRRRIPENVFTSLSPPAALTAF